YEPRREPVADVRIALHIAGVSLGNPGFGFQWEEGVRRVRAAIEFAMGGLIGKLSDGKKEVTGSTEEIAARGLDLSFAFRDGEAYVECEGRPFAVLEVGPNGLTDSSSLKPDPQGARVAVWARHADLK